MKKKRVTNAEISKKLDRLLELERRRQEAERTRAIYDAPVQEPNPWAGTGPSGLS